MKKLFLSVALVMAPVMATAGGMAHTTGDLNLRTAPSVNAAKMAVMPKGASVHVGDCFGNGWCEVSYAGHHGYASGNWMSWSDRHHSHAGQKHAHSAHNGPSEEAVAGFIFGAAAVAIAGPSGALVPQMLAGGIAGAALGEIGHELNHHDGYYHHGHKHEQMCKYTMPSSGKTWYEACPAAGR